MVNYNISIKNTRQPLGNLIKKTKEPFLIEKGNATNNTVVENIEKTFKKKMPSAETLRAQFISNNNSRIGKKYPKLTLEQIEERIKMYPLEQFKKVDRYVDGHHIIYDGITMAIDDTGRALLKQRVSIH